MAYRFIQQYGHKYGVRWLLKRLNILPNAYYNFLKNRKSEYHKRKKKSSMKLWTSITLTTVLMVTERCALIFFARDTASVV